MDIKKTDKSIQFESKKEKENSYGTVNLLYGVFTADFFNLNI